MPFSLAVTNPDAVGATWQSTQLIRECGDSWWAVNSGSIGTWQTCPQKLFDSE